MSHFVATHTHARTRANVHFILMPTLGSVSFTLSIKGSVFKMYFSCVFFFFLSAPQSQDPVNASCS